MIIRQGRRKCDFCEKEYDWTARKPEKGEIVVGTIEDVMCHNVQFFEFYRGRLIATGYCPYCGTMQQTPLVDEAIEVSNAN